MGPPGIEAGVTPQRLVDGAHAGADVGGRARRLLAPGEAERLAGSRLEEGAGEARGGVDPDAAVVEAAGERALQPDQQLHALEAAEAHLAVEGGLGGDRALGARAAHLAGEGPHHVEDALEERLLGCPPAEDTGAGGFAPSSSAIAATLAAAPAGRKHQRPLGRGGAGAPEKKKGRGRSPAPLDLEGRYYLAPRTPSLAAFATTNFSRRRAGILIASPVCGLRPMRAL